jgi:hypothetical protein
MRNDKKLSVGWLLAARKHGIRFQKRVCFLAKMAKQERGD